MRLLSAFLCTAGTALGVIFCSLLCNQYMHTNLHAHIALISAAVRQRSVELREHPVMTRANPTDAKQWLHCCVKELWY